MHANCMQEFSLWFHVTAVVRRHAVGSCRTRTSGWRLATWVDRRPSPGSPVEEAAPRRDHLGGHLVGAGRLAAEPFARAAVLPGAEQQRHLDGVGGAERGAGAGMVDPVAVHALRRRRAAREPAPTATAARRPSRRWRYRRAAWSRRAPDRGVGDARGHTRRARRPDHARGQMRDDARDPLRWRRRPPRRAEEERALLAVWPIRTVDARGCAPGASAGERGRLPGSTVGSAPRGSRGTPARRAAPRGARRSLGVRAARSARGRSSVPPAAARSASAQRSRLGGCGDVAERRRLSDDAVEQPGRGRRDEQVHRRQRAGRLPGERDPVGVAAERRDVVADPAQRGDLVEQAPVAGGRPGPGGQVGVAEPAEAARAGSSRSRPPRRPPRPAARRRRGSAPAWPIAKPPPWSHTSTGRRPSSAGVNTLRLRHCSSVAGSWPVREHGRRRAAAAALPGPARAASRTPSQPGRPGRGEARRVAYGIPRKARLARSPAAADRAARRSGRSPAQARRAGPLRLEPPRRIARRDVADAPRSTR